MKGRLVILAAVVVLLGVAGWYLASTPEEDGFGWVEVERGDLVLGVEVDGTLRSRDSSTLGPPQVPDTWDFKISFMAPEGEKVSTGDPVLGFETTDLERRLRETEAEREEAAKELEKKRKALVQEGKDDALALAEAEAKLRKAKMAMEMPETLKGAREVEKARLDLELAEIEIAHLRERIESQRRSGAAAAAILENRMARAEGKVREYRDAIRRMNVPAPRDGTVIYVADWNGQKKREGESCWRGQDILELPDLNDMVGKGQVDEADAGQIAEGQEFRIRLDAHPDVEFTGKVESIWRTVGRKNWRTSLKVVRLDMELDETDTQRMRPGMRFRGKIETERLEDALVVPLEAIFPRPEGPVVFRSTLFGHEKVPVKLGRRNEDLVRILEGLEAGDRLADQDLELRERG